ncbi:VanZ family protein [Bacillus sp. J14TS2]|uniref:VanZ family protein n=1 Tax=Bacillus sp. J14TS2 TaxID=2807188 RepID=UPI0027960E69|nr:VanZ family protein [Bacillus sp. J14TS2]
MVLLCLYLCILSKQILFKFLPLQVIVNHLTLNFEGELFWGRQNFIPFKTISYYLFSATDLSSRVRIENLAGNVIGFMPFGFLVPLLSRKLNLKAITLATFFLSLTFELIQLIFRLGSFDVDDLILNTLGGVLGYLLISLIFTFLRYIRK